MSNSEMVWQGYVADSMVLGWSDIQVEYLCMCLDEAINDTFSEVEKEINREDPLVRLAYEEEYGESLLEQTNGDWE